MRILFIGTPDYAIPSLQALIAAGHTIAAVLCQEDKVAGRKRILTAPPIKVFAQEHSLPVLQPLKVADANMEIEALRVDIFVVVAFGKLIPQSTLDLSPLPPINAHASLLPKYRGAAPAGRAIMAGEVESGVSVMRVVKALDAGPVMLVKKIPIPPAMTRFELLEKLSEISPPALVEALEMISKHEAVFVEQDHENYTYAPKINREDGIIDWSKTATEIYNQFRGVSPFPGASAVLKSKAKEGTIALKLEALQVVPCADKKPGSLIECNSEGMLVACATNAVRIQLLKPQGKRQMSAADFINGYRVSTSDEFTAE